MTMRRNIRWKWRIRITDNREKSVYNEKRRQLMQTTEGVHSLWLLSNAKTRAPAHIYVRGEVPFVPADWITFQSRLTRVAVDIDGHSMEDLGATPFLLLFSGIKVELFVKLRDLGSHVATLEKRNRTHKCKN